VSKQELHRALLAESAVCALALGFALSWALDCAAIELGDMHSCSYAHALHAAQMLSATAVRSHLRQPGTCYMAGTSCNGSSSHARLLALLAQQLIFQIALPRAACASQPATAMLTWPSPARAGHLQWPGGAARGRERLQRRRPAGSAAGTAGARAVPGARAPAAPPAAHARVPAAAGAPARLCVRL